MPRHSEHGKETKQIALILLQPLRICTPIKCIIWLMNHMCAGFLVGRSVHALCAVALCALTTSSCNTYVCTNARGMPW